MDDSKSGGDTGSTHRVTTSQSYQESFARSDPGDAHQHGKLWYNQESSDSRRWNSFAVRSPTGEGHKTGFRSASQQQQPQQLLLLLQQQRSQSERDEVNGGGNSYRQQQNSYGSPALDASLDHYAVLDIARKATESQIKKAFRKVCVLIYFCCV